MYETYDEAVNAVARFLDERRYSTSVRSKHLQCYKELKAYASAAGKPYSHETALLWLAENKENWTHAKFKAFRIAIYRLDDAFWNGAVLQEKYVHEGSSFYERLPCWARIDLDEHLDGLAATAGQELVKASRICCSHFLLFVVESGVSDIAGIGGAVVVAYQESMASDNKNTRVWRMLHSRAFLKGLAEDGKIASVAALLMSEHFTDHLPAYDMLPESLFPTNDQAGLKAEAFLEQAEYFTAYVLPAHSYSRTVLMTSAKALRTLFTFLSLNALDYSNGLAMAWIEAYKEEIGTGWKAYRKALFMFEQYRKEGVIDPNTLVPTTIDPVESLPCWARVAVRAFLAMKQREGYARSTVATYRLACCHFIAHVAKRGMTDLGQLTPGVILSFCLERGRLSNATMALYVSGMRTFLKHLADEGIVGNDLVLSAASKTAEARRCPTILNDGQYGKVCAKRAAAETPMELRDAAIVSLALWMGLRASDIMGLRLADISWAGSSITIIQQKTGSQLTLPLIAEAGNSILAYLRNGRPKSDSHHLFIKHRVPFTSLSGSAGGKALKRVLGEAYQGCSGFHVLRRTFATRMLRNGAGAGSVAEALGHITEHAVESYLSLDIARMRTCALPLACCVSDGVGGR